MFLVGFDKCNSITCELKCSTKNTTTESIFRCAIIFLEVALYKTTSMEALGTETPLEKRLFHIRLEFPVVSEMELYLEAAPASVNKAPPFSLSGP
jgi:hypothetical protein